MEVLVIVVIWIFSGFIGARFLVGKPTDEFECGMFFLIILFGGLSFLIGIGTFIVRKLYGVEKD